MNSIGRSPKDIIMLDDLPSSFMLHPEQGISIKSWHSQHSSEDKQLDNWIPILILLSQTEDSREAIKECVIDGKVDLDKAYDCCLGMVSE